MFFFYPPSTWDGGMGDPCGHVYFLSFFIFANFFIYSLGSGKQQTETTLPSLSILAASVTTTQGDRLEDPSVKLPGAKASRGSTMTTNGISVSFPN
jgi:hypothetical protein